MSSANKPLDAQDGASESVNNYTGSAPYIGSRRYHARGTAQKANIGRSRASVVKRRGRKRGARSMGRHPFLDCARRYEESVKGLYAATTQKVVARGLRLMAKDFETLRENGCIVSSNPMKIVPDDVTKYIALLKARGVRESGIVHNLSILNSLLLSVGNPAVEEFKRRNPAKVPKRRAKRYDPVSSEDQDRILARAGHVDGWRNLQAYALVLLCIGTGLRPKEVRLSNVGDLGTSSWRIKAVHVKGEDSYGQVREIPIDPKVRPVVKRYLASRAEVVAKWCPMNQALFPAINDSKGDGYLSSNSLRKLKRIVEADTGTTFELRACRRTFGQNLIDQGATIETVSVLLGHSTTKTTETYYARKKQDAAILEATRIWDQKPPNAPSAKTPLIEPEKYLSGYA